METCKLCGVEPQAYLTDVLTGRILSNYRRCAI
ncbi:MULTISPECIES: transposase domain-containing protein [Bradyrhizobium]